MCSSVEELEHERLNQHISHESISLDEERRLVKEIKTLEKTRPRVSSKAAKQAKMQDIVVERDAIQDQVKIIIHGLKEGKAARSKIKVLGDKAMGVESCYELAQAAYSTSCCTRSSTWRPSSMGSSSMITWTT